VRSNADKSLFPVPEAAKALGISPEAVRSRLARGTLESVKEGNTVFVLLDSDITQSNTDITTDEGLIRQRLDSEVQFLREELIRREESFRRREESWVEESRRKDSIIAALTQRIPAIEAPKEETADARESPVSASEDTSKGEVPDDATEGEIRQSWWQRWFGTSSAKH
jgi:hypothetical protein